MRRDPDGYEPVGGDRYRAWFGDEYVYVHLTRERNYPGLQWVDVHHPMYECAHAWLPPEAVHVLDAGCGSGYGHQYLPGREVIGLEVSEDAVEFARLAFPDLRRVVYGNLYQAPLSFQGLDAVVCVEAIEHVYHPDVALRGFAQCLRDGGYLFLTTPDGARGQPLGPFHVREYTWDELREMVERAGFKDIQRHVITGQEWSLVLTARKACGS